MLSLKASRCQSSWQQPQLCAIRPISRLVFHLRRAATFLMSQLAWPHQGARPAPAGAACLSCHSCARSFALRHQRQSPSYLEQPQKPAQHVPQQPCHGPWLRMSQAFLPRTSTSRSCFARIRHGPRLRLSLAFLPRTSSGRRCPARIRHGPWLRLSQAFLPRTSSGRRCPARICHPASCTPVPGLRRPSAVNTVMQRCGRR
jgi:hypothetical protein